MPQVQGLDPADLQTVVQALQNIVVKLGSVAQTGMPTWTVPSPASTVTHSAVATSILIKTGAGALLSVNVNTAAAGSLAFHDGTSSAGTLIGTISTTAVGLFNAPWAFNTGLFVVQTGTADVTIVSM